MPADLAAALDPDARAFWDGLPPSARRVGLARLALARRADTRARRVAALAAALARGERPTP
jgi:uncharacterized protein YdeI (YjbR/CyaY-like superfamily)